MKIAILVASHLTKSRIAYIRECFRSLNNQSVKADIFASISFESDLQEKLELIIKDFPGINFRIKVKKTSQMNHLRSLTNEVNKYDLLMFCDDDDTYKAERVEEFVKHLEAGFSGVREICDQVDARNPEFWAYGIKPALIKDFFLRIDEAGLSGELSWECADMYLSWFLSKNQLVSKGISSFRNSKGHLYNYTKDNEDSITNRESSGDIIKDHCHNSKLNALLMPNTYLEDAKRMLSKELYQIVSPHIVKVTNVLQAMYS